jgi:hypothetical protein
MSTLFESNPERPLGPPRDQAEADSRRRAECAEKISRLLSALDGAPSTGKTEYLTKKVIRKVKSNPDSGTSTRFLLIDGNGPIGEFGSWEDASQYRNDIHHHGSSIIGARQKPLEPGAVREQTANQQANPPLNLQANPPPNQQANPLPNQQANPLPNLQANPPANQQANPPANQQANPPANQQTNPPANLQANPPANQQANPPANLLANPLANQPAGITGGFNSPNRSTIQELEKADDLGDSHPNPLRQGGALPANSTVMRIVGKFFPAAAKTVTLNACPQFLTNRYEVFVQGNTSAQITNEVGLGNLTLTCAPPAANYETIKIHYTAELTNASIASD